MIYMICPGQDEEVIFVRTDDDDYVRLLASSFGHRILGACSFVQWLEPGDIVPVTQYRSRFAH
jgi:hypothetical protein